MHLLLLLTACTGTTDSAPPDTDADADSDTDTDTDADSDTDTDVDASTWSVDVYPLVGDSCRDCHRSWGETSGEIYTSWMTLSEEGLPFITAGSPADSYVYLKITDPPRGGLMPLQLTNVSQTDIDALRTWIENGALDDDEFDRTMWRLYDNSACDDCHSDWAAHGDHDGLYATVTTRVEDGYPLIDPGNPENSYVYLKISSDDPPEGGRMPMLIPPLEESEIADIAAWITAGALED